MTRLVKAGLVAADWNAEPDKGMVTDSVVVIVTRKGNPKNIKTWDDLTKPGVEVITPNPFTSGGARWNIMAALRRGVEEGRRTRRPASTYLNELFKNVPVQDDSARKAAADLHRRQGRRAALATRTRRSSPSRTARTIDYTVPDDDDPDREPGRGHQDAARTRRRPRRSSTSCYTPDGAEDLRRERLPPGRLRRRRPTSSRRRRACSPSTTSAAGATVTKKFFDPDRRASWPTIEQSNGVAVTAK